MHFGTGIHAGIIVPRSANTFITPFCATKQSGRKKAGHGNGGEHQTKGARCSETCCVYRSSRCWAKERRARAQSQTEWPSIAYKIWQHSPVKPSPLHHNKDIPETSVSLQTLYTLVFQQWSRLFAAVAFLPCI